MTAWRRIAYGCALLLAGAGVIVTAGSLLAGDRTVSSANGRRGVPRYYVDPMHPTYRFDRPGTAPDCGMALVPVYEPEAVDTGKSDAGVVHIGPAQQKVIGATVSAARRMSGQQDVRLYAQVVPDETRLYKVNVGIDGFITNLSAVTTGSEVAKDQWLATFSAPEARTAIQSYLVAVDAAARGLAAGDDSGQIDVASAGIQQARDRLLNIGMAPGQIDHIRRTRIVPPDIQVAAPARGIVLARTMSAGERFERGSELYRIADLRRVWIRADLVGAVAEHVVPGMAAEVSIPGRSATLHAKVSATLPEFDPSTQSLKLRLEAENPGFVLRPGMFVDARLTIERPAGIAVPVDAVVDAGLRKRVFVERRAGVFEPRDVETGWRFGAHVEIVKGLSEGERVVVGGAFLFDSESRMRQTRSERARQ